MYVFESDYGIIINPMNQILMQTNMFENYCTGRKKRRHKQVEHEWEV